MRYFLIVGMALAILCFGAGLAWATKMTPPGTSSHLSCANVRCSHGTQCIETLTGPICQHRILSCANVLCERGNQCMETISGPQCVPYQPTYPVNPNPSQQSCAYGGYYRYGRLICNPVPEWRGPYQQGWGHYYPNYPRPMPRPIPTPRPLPRPPWHPHGPDIVRPKDPEPRYCTMEYDPVCAEKPVVCVRAPCPAERRTFSNSCQANAAEYTILYRGACQ